MIKPVWQLSRGEKWRMVGVEESCAAAGIKAPPLPEGKNLNFPDGMKPTDLPCVVYHRMAPGNYLYWHQFWTWWPYNPKNYPTERGVGEHEGDWELVQIGCADKGGDRPVLVTYSQHGGGEKRMWHRVALDEDDLQRRPIVYVAVDSHANYFGPERSATDKADGKGATIKDYEIRKFDGHDWVEWMGRWGNSKNSPGPLTTRRAWRAPHAYHDQCRG